jgi:hypothetical protein
MTPTRDRTTDVQRSRAERARLIRRRVAVAAVTLFVAAWLMITVTLVTGHDPALARARVVGTSSASAGSTSSNTAATTSSSGNSGSSGYSGNSGYYGSSGNSGSSGNTGNSGSSGSSVTTRQS